MAKRTKADIQRDMEALQAELDSAEPDDEVWVKDESGREIKLTGRRASSVLSRFADLFTDDATPADEGEGDEEEEGDELPDKKPAGGNYFKRRG